MDAGTQPYVRRDAEIHFEEVRQVRFTADIRTALAFMQQTLNMIGNS